MKKSSDTARHVAVIGRIMLFSVSFIALITLWFAPTLWGLDSVEIKLLCAPLLLLCLWQVFSILIKQLRAAALFPITRKERRIDLLIGLIILLLLCVSRFPFFINLNGWIDSDNALTGLMAKHIVEGGAPPLFLYGQAYLGSLTAHLVAAVSLVVGISIYSLKIVPFASFSLFVLLHTMLSRSLLGTKAAMYTLLFFLLAPAHLFIVQFDTSGGFMEMLLLSTASFAMLHMSYGCTQIQGAAAYHDFLTVMVFGAGLSAGLALWSNPMSISLVLVCLLMIMVRSPKKLMGSSISIFIWGNIVGNWPTILSEITYNFVQTRFLFGREGTALSPTVVIHRFRQLFSEGFPAVILGPLVNRADLLLFKRAGTAFLLIALALSTILFLKGVAKKRLSIFQDDLTLVVIHFILFVGIFCASGFGNLVNPPRYLIITYFSLPLVLAVGLKSESRLVQVIVKTLIVTLLAMATFANLQITKTAQSTASLWREYCHFLEEKDIRYAFSDYWMAYVTTFLTNEQTTCCVISGKDCYPPYCEEVQPHKAKAAYIFHDNIRRTRRLERKLRRRIRKGRLKHYHRKRFGPIVIIYYSSVNTL